MVSQKEAAKTHHDTARLNDLRKFSQDYKINTPVPEDLRPILAKDKSRDVSETTSPRRPMHIWTEWLRPCSTHCPPSSRPSR